MKAIKARMRRSNLWAERSGQEIAIDALPV